MRMQINHEPHAWSMVTSPELPGRNAIEQVICSSRVAFLHIMMAAEHSLLGTSRWEHLTRIGCTAFRLL